MIYHTHPDDTLRALALQVQPPNLSTQILWRAMGVAQLFGFTGVHDSTVNNTLSQSADAIQDIDAPLNVIYTITIPDNWILPGTELASLQAGAQATVIDVTPVTDTNAGTPPLSLADELQANVIDVLPQPVDNALVAVGDTASNIVDTIYTATAADQSGTTPAPATDAEKAARTKKVLLGASVALFLFKVLH